MSLCSNKIRVSVTYLITIALINKTKKLRLLFLTFTEIAILNTPEMFCNHQIAKLNIRKMFFFLSTC